MAPRPAVRLFTPTQAVVFVLVLSVIVYALVPKHADIASLKLSSPQVESLRLTREGLDPSVFADRPGLIRRWIELLREDGRTSEALDFARKLVALRPKNKGYWNILLQALNDDNQLVEEQLTRLKLIEQGMLEANRIENLRIATTLKWLKDDRAYVEALESMIQRKVYERDDVESLLQAYASPLFESTEGRARIDRLVRTLEAHGTIKQETHETLSALYAALTLPVQSALHAALSVGLPAEQAQEFAQGSRAPSTAFIASLAALPPRKLEQLIDLANFHARPSFAPALYHALHQRGALSFTRTFEYINASLNGGNKALAVRLARELPQRMTLTNAQWFELAQMLGYLGQREQSIRIMKRLLAEPTLKRPAPRG